MKKIYFSIVALALISFCKVSNAQNVSVTLQVDVTNLVASSQAILPAGMRVGGTFLTNLGTSGGFAMKDWTPGDTASKMTDMGNNLWSIDITFDATRIADTLNFKFVDGTWDPIGTNEGHGAPGVDPGLINGGCANSGGNRVFVIPATSGQIWKWCYDSCKQCNGAGALLSGVQQVNNKVSIFSLAPNPSPNKQSVLMYSVSENSPVSVSLYNVLGQQVKSFVNTTRPAGVYNQPIDLNEFSKGVYFIQLTSGNQTVAKKIVIN